MAAVIAVKAALDRLLPRRVLAFAALDDPIMFGARIGVAQAAIGLLDVGEPARQLARDIGMVPLGEADIGLADLSWGGRAREPQHLIEIALSQRARTPVRRAWTSAATAAIRASVGA